MIRTVRNVVRLLTIARILARHDALFPLESLGITPFIIVSARLISRRPEPGRPGQRLARALHEAGPSFIKLGQALSTRSDLMGEEMTADLSELQDSLPPFPGSQARAIIEEELGKPIGSLFRSFDDRAVAAGSIAQVHFAEDSDGRPVAVKVLRPGVRRKFERDLDLFLWVAKLIETARPEWRRLRPVEAVRTLAESVAFEMDLRFEASAAVELAENFADDPGFLVPAVDWGRTAQRVLTTERVYGIPFDDREAVIAHGLDPHDVLAKAAGAFFLQVFRDGFFHGDLHAGNVFVRADGGLAFVDFGIMGRLSRRDRHHLAELLLAFMTRDYRRAAEVHFEAGWVPSHRSVDAFTQACRSVGEPIMDKPQNEISMAKLLGQLFYVTEAFEMETQPQLLLLQKTMLVAEGTGRRLCPDANMWLLARPLIEGWMGDMLAPNAIMRERMAEVGDSLSRFPELLRRVEHRLEMLAEHGVRLDPNSLRPAFGWTESRLQVTLLAIIAVLFLLFLLAGV
ncbi:MAG: 2-polyprenylphenol 6-hydroxylase [Rhodospirillales bacterium]|nr:2-polyprenylphenol 6-hydroxylase [Rhodospirillales bacterium]